MLEKKNSNIFFQVVQLHNKSQFKAYLLRDAKIEPKETPLNLNSVFIN